MRRVVLIRHAQASFGASDYDRLSALGEQQAAHLGEWLATRSDIEFVALVSGTMRRHAQTVAAIAAAYAAAQGTLPARIDDPDWNEFDHRAVIESWAHAHADDPQLAQARANGDRRAIHAVLAAALHAWARGELPDVPESWPAFAARIARARTRIAREMPPGPVLVISSGGAITRCAQAALGIDDRRAVELNLALRNTALGEFHRDEHEWRLLAWNALPHFAATTAPELVTYY